MAVSEKERFVISYHISTLKRHKELTFFDREPIDAEAKWPPFFQRHFQMFFCEAKCVNSDENFIAVSSQGSNQQNSSIGSDNGFGIDQVTSHYLIE